MEGGMKLLIATLLAVFSIGCCSKASLKNEQPPNYDKIEIIDWQGYHNPERIRNKVLYTLHDKDEINKLYNALKKSQAICPDLVLSGYLPTVKFIDSKANRVLTLIMYHHDCQISIYEIINGEGGLVLNLRSENFIKPYLQLLREKTPKVFAEYDERAKRYGAKNLEDFLINGVKK